MGNVHVPTEQERKLALLARDMDLLNSQHAEVADETHERTEVDQNLVQQILGVLPGLLPLFLKNAQAVAGITTILPFVLGLFRSKPKPHQEHIDDVPASPVVPPPTTPTPATPVTPPVAPAGVVPDFIEIGLAGSDAVKSPDRTDKQVLPFTMDGNRVVLVGNTTSLDDGSTIALDAGIQANGKGLRIDMDPARTPAGQVNHPELLGKQVYIAEDAATGEVLGSIGGKGNACAQVEGKWMLTGDVAHFDNGVSFVENRYRETGGMSPTVRLKRQGGPVRIFARILDAESGSIVTPEIR